MVTLYQRALPHGERWPILLVTTHHRAVSLPGGEQYLVARVAANLGNTREVAPQRGFVFQKAIGYHVEAPLWPQHLRGLAYKTLGNLPRLDTSQVKRRICCNEIETL